MENLYSFLKTLTSTCKIKESQKKMYLANIIMKPWFSTRL